MENKNLCIDQKLNILQVHNFYRQTGGEDVVVRSEAAMLKEHGHQVFGYYRKNADIENLSLIKKLMLPISSFFSLETYFQVRKIIKVKEIDVLHVHNTMHLISPSVFYAAKKEGIPVVMTAHNYRLCCPKGTFYRNKKVCEKCMERGLQSSIIHRCYRQSLLQSLVQGCNTFLHRRLHTYSHVHFICLTSFQKKVLCKLEDVTPDHIFIKPNFYNTKKLAEANQENSILYVGRLEEEKGIWDLLKAYEKMTEKSAYENFSVPRLIICGEGSLSEKCRQYAEKNSLRNVIFIGEVGHEAVLREMSKAQYLVIPSRWYEGMPMVLVEAYQTKIPVVVPDLGGFSDLVEDGINGFKYKGQSADELAKLMIKMCKNPEDMACSFSEQSQWKLTEYENNYMELMNIYERCMKDVWNSKKKSTAGK